MNEEHRRAAIGLPDFDSPETRNPLGPSALTAFFKMAQLWRLSEADAQQLLGAVIGVLTKSPFDAV